MSACFACTSRECGEEERGCERQHNVEQSISCGGKKKEGRGTQTQIERSKAEECDSPMRKDFAEEIAGNSNRKERCGVDDFIYCHS